MSHSFSPLYAILSADLFPGAPEDWARRLADAGVGIIQYRAKQAAAGELLRVARRLSSIAQSHAFRLVMNDRADIAALAGAGGVHVGQDDLPVEVARRICGPECWVGVSTHTLEQVRAAAATSADYIAVGPVYATATKANPEPVVGIEFVRQARKLTEKPLVAIGGITAERAAEVYAAGADSLAVAADLAAARDLAARVRAYLRAAEQARAARAAALGGPP
ncbi:MAG TPA: thiamine phosphate synthase [Candidatus Acidoferrales bacterium]|nr:thiamine phosphate synthase [Candidatus Acidoferrales bacterium]